MRRSIFAVRRFAFGVGSWTAILYGLDTQISISNRLNRTSARRVRPRCSRMYSGRWLVPRDFRKGISPSADSRLIRLPALMQCSGIPAPRVLSWGWRATPCTDHPVFVAAVVVNIPGCVTSNFVGPDARGLDFLVSGTFTPVPEPATWSAAAAALAILLRLRALRKGGAAPSKLPIRRPVLVQPRGLPYPRSCAIWRPEG